MAVVAIVLVTASKCSLCLWRVQLRDKLEFGQRVYLRPRASTLFKTRSKDRSRKRSVERDQGQGQREELQQKG